MLKGLWARTFLDLISKNISACTEVKICGHWKQYVPNAFSDSEENQNDSVIPMQLTKMSLDVSAKVIALIKPLVR